MAQFEHCKKAEIPAEKGRPLVRCTVSTISTGGLLLTLPRDFKCSPDTPVIVVLNEQNLSTAVFSCADMP